MAEAAMTMPLGGQDSGGLQPLAAIIGVSAYPPQA